MKTRLFRRGVAVHARCPGDLCFGRLDLRDGRTVYIGRPGLSRDGVDEPLPVDWCAPVW